MSFLERAGCLCGDRRFLWGVFLLYALAGFYFLDKFPPFYADESYYAEPAVSFLERGTFWNGLYAGIPGFEKTNVTQGRIFSLVSAGIFKCFGLGVATVRLQSFCLGLLTLLLVYRLALALGGGPLSAFLSAAALAFSHLFLFASHFGRPDMAVGFWITLAVALFVRGEKRNSAFLLFLGGLCSALPADAHLSGMVGIFVYAFLLCRFLCRRPAAGSALLAGAAGILLGVLWWLTMHVVLNWDVFAKQWVFVNAHYPVRFNPFSYVEKELFRWKSFFWWGAYHRNLLLLVLFLLSLWQALRRRQDYGYAVLLLAVWGGLLGLALAAPNRTTWYIIGIYPLMVLLIVRFLSDWLGGPGARKAVAVCLSAAYVALIGSEAAYKLKFLRSDYTAFMAKVKEHIPPGEKVFASETYWLGLKGYAPLLGMWVVMTKNNYEAMGVKVKAFEGSFADFMRREGVRYVIADREALEFPQTERWLKPYLAEHCALVGEIEDDFYGTSLYLARKSPEPMRTQIYKVLTSR